MKKLFGKICLVLFMVSIYASPASAGLKVDVSQLTGTVSKYITKVAEATEKVTQQINQIKLMGTQGFNWDALKERAVQYYKKQFKMIKITDLVKGTKAKKLQTEKDKAESYKQGSIDLYKEKEKIAKQDYNHARNQFAAAAGTVRNLEQECSRLQAEYDQLEAGEPGAGEKIIVKLAECRSNLETAINNREEWKAQIGYIEYNMGGIKQKLELFESENDKVQVAYKERIDKLEGDKVEEETKKEIEYKKVQDKEWDSEDALESYQVDEAEYKEFMKNYFYDAKLKSSQSGLDYENYINRIMRNRKYLYINAAVHLMQVTATTRRELPERIKTADEMFEQTLKGDELPALIAYSNARLENAKALFLYAKLLSAKIQYLAAKDLVDIEVKKEISDEEGNLKNYEGFNLEKYILTEEYIKKMQEEANQTRPRVSDEKVEMHFYSD